MPVDASECRSDYSYCCSIKMNVKLINGSYVEKKFCVSSPSDIKLKDVKIDINDYTNSELVQIICNSSKYFQVIFGLWYYLY